MKAVIVYESMYGNTHAIADRIADGLRTHADVTVVSVSEATASMIEDADLLLVGGPTHERRMSDASSRATAVARSSQGGSQLAMDQSANQIGLRTWLQQLPDAEGRGAAAFDTRWTGPALLTGSASRWIARLLEHHGFDLVADPRSFLVDHDNHLTPDAGYRAFTWGRRLGALERVDGPRERAQSK